MMVDESIVVEWGMGLLWQMRMMIVWEEEAKSMVSFSKLNVLWFLLLLQLEYSMTLSTTTYFNIYICYYVYNVHITYMYIIIVNILKQKSLHPIPLYRFHSFSCSFQVFRTIIP